MPSVQPPIPKIVVNNVFSRICGILSPETIYNLNAVLSYKIKDPHYIVSAIRKKLVTSNWDGTIRLFWDYQGNRFYTGMMSDVIDVLDKAGVSYIIDDRRVIPSKNLSEMKFILPPTKFERPYQNVVIASMIKATRGIMQAATGAGKTFITSKLIGSIKSGPFLFFVPSIDIMDQAYECLSDCLTVPIGRIGDNNFDIQQINVVMVQTAIKALNRNNPKFKIVDYKYDENDQWDDKPIDVIKAEAVDKLIRSAKGIYYDEVHHAACKTAIEIMGACTNAYYRYGGSATPFREDGAEKMIKALFGRVVQKISASWLIRNKYLVKPYILNIKMKDDHGHFDSYPEIYKHYIVQNDILNETVARIAIRMKNMGIPTLILVQQYPHGNAIQKMIPDAPFIKGNMPRKKRKAAIAGLRDGSIPYAIATTLADEGLDVERLGAVIIAGGGKSITRVYQRVGRAIRTFPDKERALVFIFHHNTRILDHHGDRVARILSMEPEFVITKTEKHRIMDNIDALLRPNNSGLFA
jgi:superfamily II DNA or RNA helicase